MNVASPASKTFGAVNIDRLLEHCRKECFLGEKMSLAVLCSIHRYFRRKACYLRRAGHRMGLAIQSDVAHDSL